MFKDFLVPLIGTPADETALDAALALAAPTAGHVTALRLVNLPMPANAPWGLMPELAMGEVYDRLRAQGEAEAATLRQRLARESTPTEVRVAEAMFVEPSRVVARHAHTGDLTVIGGSIGDTPEAGIMRAYLGSLLLESGRPVLVVPPGHALEVPLRRIVVAWQPTRESARAVAEALPLLQRAEAVEVAIVETAGGEVSDDRGTDIASHLARHGVKTNLVFLEAAGRPVSEVLLEYARLTQANLLVAGGYGHSRLRQWALGGTTRELLLSSPIPLFFSH